MIKAIRGTRDILPLEVREWQQVEDAAREIFELYAYQEIRTPLFEETELFARSIGQETDIVAKEMYSFRDRGDVSLSLRPEGTASVVRAYIEHHLDRQVGPVAKLYYMGPMFRYERPQKGRYRQFHQIGAEVLGSEQPTVEAEVIEMLFLLLDRLKVPSAQLLINSLGDAVCRPGYLASLKESVGGQLDKFCPDCQRRAQTNPLRVLDCKNESCQPLIARLPSVLDALCSPCRDHFDRFRASLEDRGLPYALQPRLVRGLDYYVRTTFEIVSGELGAQNALVGGGRYDGLSELLGGPPVQGFGFALGLERFVLVLPESVTESLKEGPDVFLAPLGDEAHRYCTGLATRLRRRGIACDLDYEPGRTLRSQMKHADRVRARYVLIIGERELGSGQFTLRRMSDGWQEPISEEGLFAHFGPVAGATAPTNFSPTA
ncbi:MAG: histidine--tRNA ligase [Acidobacteria bacterium]|nr:histidine--tRNA ligase [Acidobacteriota bacterium]